MNPSVSKVNQGREVGINDSEDCTQIIGWLTAMHFSDSELQRCSSDPYTNTHADPNAYTNTEADPNSVPGRSP